MAKNERFLTVDIGATSIKLCEFEFDDAGQMVMTVFAYREYEEELSDETRMGVVEGVLRQMLMESNVRARRALVSLSGQSALIRFGKINVIKDDKKQIRQLAEFEAKHNIPFALDDISLDYQLIAGNAEEQAQHTLEVMSIVVKREVVDQYTQAIRNVGLTPLLIDVAPVACYNAARANNLGENECVLLVSIGGRSTNLVFIEGERFFARTIPIAGYAITQQIAKEFGIGLPEAEELKRHHGFVSLGGAYADPVSETAANVSKIIRNVMSRLHGEISRSINIYRAQQHGNAPSKIYLTGGTSILTYCDVFFSEKFNIPVEYFNPFPVVNLSPTIDRTKLSEVAHMFGETIGLGFRYARRCPIEINLLAKNIQRQQTFSQRKPYLIAAMFCICLIGAVFTLGFREKANIVESTVEPFAVIRDKFKPQAEDLTRKIQAAQSAQNQLDDMRKFLAQRAVWPMLFAEIARCKPDNVWIDSITPIIGDVKPFEASSDTAAMAQAQKDAAANPDMPIDFNDMPDLSMDPGAAAGGGPGGPSAAPTEASKVKLGGFVIQGHVIEPQDVETKDPATLPAPVPAPAFVFEAPAKPTDDATKQATTKNSAYGEYVFLANLKASPLFSAEPNMTTFRSQGENMVLNPSDRRNIVDFTLQAKLLVNPEFFFRPFLQQQGGGSFGRGGDNSQGFGAPGSPSPRRGRGRRGRARPPRTP